MQSCGFKSHLPQGCEIVGNVEKSNVSGVFFFIGIGVTRGNTLSQCFFELHDSTFRTLYREHIGVSGLY